MKVDVFIDDVEGQTRVSVDSLPATVRASFSVMDSTFIAKGSLSNWVGRLSFSRSNFMSLTAVSIPAGPLDVEVKLGVAGRIIARAAGYIGGVSANIVTGKCGEFVAFAAQYVSLEVEWDFDGDTKHEWGLPYFFFINTHGGVRADVDARIHFGKVRLNIAAVGGVFGALQKWWDIESFLFLPKPNVRGNGRVCAAYTPHLSVGVEPFSYDFPFSAIVPDSLCFHSPRRARSALRRWRLACAA